MFRQRLLSALIGIPLVIGAVWAGSFPFFLVLLAVNVFALREWFSLEELQEQRIVRLGYLGCIIILTAAHFYNLYGLFAGFIFFFLLLNVDWVIRFPAEFQHVLLTLWGQLHITCLLAFFLLLRNL